MHTAHVRLYFTGCFHHLWNDVTKFDRITRLQSDIYRIISIKITDIRLIEISISTMKFIQWPEPEDISIQWIWYKCECLRLCQSPTVVHTHTHTHVNVCWSRHIHHRLIYQTKIKVAWNVSVILHLVDASVPVSFLHSESKTFENAIESLGFLFE